MITYFAIHESIAEIEDKSDLKKEKKVLFPRNFEYNRFKLVCLYLFNHLEVMILKSNTWNKIKFTICHWNF